MDNRSVRIAAVLAAVAAVVAVAVLLVTTYRSADGSEPTTRETTAPVEGTPAPAGPVTPGPSDTEEGGPADDASPGYVPDARTKAALADVTMRFLEEWRRPGTAKERERRIRPYATAWLTTRLANVDPAELPTSRIVGKPAIVAATPYAAGTSTRFRDGLRIRCNLVLDPTGWRVAEVLPDTDTPQPTPPRRTAGQSSRTSPAPDTTTPNPTTPKATAPADPDEAP